MIEEDDLLISPSSASAETPPQSKKSTASSSSHYSGGDGLAPVPAFHDDDDMPHVCFRWFCPICSIFCYEGCSEGCVLSVLLAMFGWLPASVYAVFCWTPAARQRSHPRDTSPSATVYRNDEGASREHTGRRHSTDDYGRIPNHY